MAVSIGCRWPLHEFVSVDATGAGDAFAGTLAAGLAKGRTLIEAGTFANAAAALATTEFGAQQPAFTEGDLLALLNRGGHAASAQVE
jgi:sugar/nucleoside kinase (ribokinase family)